MVNPVPEIIVTSEIKKVKNTNPLIRDIVCLIGCFESGDEYTPVFCKDLTEAETTFGDDTEYDGNRALKKIFHKDISGCLIVNVPSTTSGTEPNITITQNITKKKLEDSLNTVALIDIDQLYVATELTDELITVIDDFCNDRFESKRPCGYIGAGSRTGASAAAILSAYETTAGKLKDHCYAFITQTLTVNGDELDLIETGAYLTNLIANLPVGNSLTASTLPEVTGVGTTYTFEKGATPGLGRSLVGLGFFVVRLIDALNNTYEVVNSAAPNGLDLYMNRVRDYIVNDYALRETLGKYNHITMELISLESGRLYTKFTDTLKLIKDIEYIVEQEDFETVNLIIRRLVFAGIVVKIHMSISIEVE